MQTNLGRLGVWTFAFDRLPPAQAQDVAAQLDALGYGAIWVPDAVGRDPMLTAYMLLSGTDRICLATGIASIYGRDAAAMNAGWQTLSEAFPGRFMLGLGVSHRVRVEDIGGHTYGPPIATMRAYLDAMDHAIYRAVAPTVAPQRCLAALGPKMLALAAERTSGAHPYYVPPEHTAIARTTMGPDAFLGPEQKVILETDPAKAREIARTNIGHYLTLPNYVNNLVRLGFTIDDVEHCTDRLVDAIVAWGDEDAIRRRVQAHYDAGADHVAIQVLSAGDFDATLRDWTTLAAALL